MYGIFMGGPGVRVDTELGGSRVYRVCIYIYPYIYIYIYWLYWGNGKENGNYYVYSG